MNPHPNHSVPPRSPAIPAAACDPRTQRPLSPTAIVSLRTSAVLSLAFMFAAPGCGWHADRVLHSSGSDTTLIRQRGGLWGVPLPYRLELTPVPLVSKSSATRRITPVPERDFSRPHLSLVVKSSAPASGAAPDQPIVRIRIQDGHGSTLVSRIIGGSQHPWEIRSAGRRAPDLAQSIPADAFPPRRRSTPDTLVLTVEVLQSASVPRQLHVTAY